MKLKDLNVKLKLDSKQFHTGLTKAGGAAKVFGGKMAVVATIGGKALKGLGGIARKLGSIFKSVLSKIARMLKMAFKIGMVAAVAAIGLGIKAAIDFEEQLANVNTMLDESSAKYLPGYASAMKNMAMEFGESTKTLSKGLYDILSASVAPSEALDVLRTSVMAAKGGMTDAGIAADAITTILNSYGLSASNAADVSDWLFAIVKRGKLTFGDLASGIGKVASTAAIAGVSLEDLGAMVATMTRAGIRSEEAMTAMNGVLRSFLGATDTAKKKAKELGFEMSTNTIRTRGLLWIMKKMNDLTAEQVRELFPNIRGLKGMAAALQQVGNYEYDVAFMTNRSGLAMAAYKKMTDTTKFSLGKLWQTIKMTAQSIGENLSPKIKQIADDLSVWLRQLQEDKIIETFVENALKEFDEFKDGWIKRFEDAKGEFKKVFKEDIEKAVAKLCDTISKEFDKALNYISEKIAEIPVFFNNAMKRFSTKNFEHIEKSIMKIVEALVPAINGMQLFMEYTRKAAAWLESMIGAIKIVGIIFSGPQAQVGMALGPLGGIAGAAATLAHPTMEQARQIAAVPERLGRERELQITPVGERAGDVLRKELLEFFKPIRKTMEFRKFAVEKMIPSEKVKEIVKPKMAFGVLETELPKYKRIPGAETGWVGEPSGKKPLDISKFQQTDVFTRVVAAQFEVVRTRTRGYHDRVVEALKLIGDDKVAHRKKMENIITTLRTELGIMD